MRPLTDRPSGGASYCKPNVLLLKYAADMQIPVMRFAVLPQQQISQEQLQILCRLMDAVLQIGVIGTA